MGQITIATSNAQHYVVKMGYSILCPPPPPPPTPRSYWATFSLPLQERKIKVPTRSSLQKFLAIEGTDIATPPSPSEISVLQCRGGGGEYYMEWPNALHYDKTKKNINKQILCRFQKQFFQGSKKWYTPILRCFWPCQVDLWAETLPFSVVLPLENT